MVRDLLSRPAFAIVTGCLAVVIAVVGCSGGPAAPNSSSAPSAPSQPTTQSQPATPSQSAGQGSPVPVVPLKRSKFYFLTKLSPGNLCGLLHGAEPSAILGTPAGPATYVNTLGLGVVCTWSRSGGGELYIGISTIFPWRGARPFDKFVGDKPTTIDGHQADIGGPNSRIPYATAHVAISGLNDPVVEFRAPTRSAVLKLALKVLPRLLAISRAG